MTNLDRINIISSSTKSFSFLRIQDGIFPFFEKPSEEHDTVEKKEMVTFEKRITAIDLFSHFTANIIKEKVIFIR
ncbi:MAG: hypothetical protein ABI594_11450 [Ginsengibacter sp.]